MARGSHQPASDKTHSNALYRSNKVMVQISDSDTDNAGVITYRRCHVLSTPLTYLTFRPTFRPTYGMTLPLAVAFEHQHIPDLVGGSIHQGTTLPECARITNGFNQCTLQQMGVVCDTYSDKGPICMPRVMDKIAVCVLSSFNKNRAPYFTRTPCTRCGTATELLECYRNVCKRLGCVAA